MRQRLDPSRSIGRMTLHLRLLRRVLFCHVHLNVDIVFDQLNRFCLAACRDYWPVRLQAFVCFFAKDIPMSFGLKVELVVAIFLCVLCCTKLHSAQGQDLLVQSQQYTADPFDRRCRRTCSSTQPRRTSLHKAEDDRLPAFRDVRTEFDTGTVRPEGTGGTG